MHGRGHTMIHKINNTIASTQGHCPACSAERGPLFGVRGSLFSVRTRPSWHTVSWRESKEECLEPQFQIRCLLKLSKKKREEIEMSGLEGACVCVRARMAMQNCVCVHMCDNASGCASMSVQTGAVAVTGGGTDLGVTWVT